MQDSYIMRQPKFVLGVGIAGTVIFLAMYVAAVFASDGWVGFVFLPFCALGTFLAVYAIRWKIAVNGDTLRISYLFKPLLEIDMSDIEHVAREYSGIIAYKDGKRLFAVEYWVLGYEALYNRLRELGKTESTRKFCVKRSRAEPVIGIIGVLFCLVLSAVGLFFNTQSTSLFECAAFLGFAALCAVYTAATLRWKFVVAGNLLVCQTLLRRERTVHLKDIDEIKVKKSAILLISNGKSIIKVESAYKGFATLEERLREERIPFYRRNKLIDFDIA